MTHQTPPPNAKNAKNIQNSKSAQAKNAKNAKNAKPTAEETKNAQVAGQTTAKDQAKADGQGTVKPGDKASETVASSQPDQSAVSTQPEAKPDASGKTGKPSNPAKRGVQRTITYIEPVSALKMALIFNLALFAVWFVAMALIYIVLSVAGTWDRLDSLVGDLTSSDGFSAGMYFGGVIAIGLFEVVLFTLLAPVAALIYNASSSILGGVRIQLDR